MLINCFVNAMMPWRIAFLNTCCMYVCMYDVLFTIDHLRSISFFCQNAHHDWLTKEYISNWFLVKQNKTKQKTKQNKTKHKKQKQKRKNLEIACCYMFFR